MSTRTSSSTSPEPGRGPSSTPAVPGATRRRGGSAFAPESRRADSGHSSPAGSIDPITLQVIAASVSGIVREMQNSLFRTGYSTIIRESHDASCALLDPAGRLVGQHVVLPTHMGAFPACVEGLLAAYGPEEMEDGDAYIMNHPYLGGSAHSPDMAVVTPVFVAGRLVGFCADMAHKSDLGAAVPGGGGGQARELFQEGILIPPVRFLRAGRLDPSVEALLSANSRTPELVLGDLRGQIGANRIGEQRMQALAARHGPDVVLAAFEALFEKTEARVRDALARWRDGEYRGESCLDNDGIELNEPVPIRVTVRKRGDRILFDFADSAPQRPGPINIRPPLVRACCYYALVAMVDPRLPNNYGLARVVETQFAERSVLNPAFPAPVGVYSYTLAQVVEAVLQALGQLAPEYQIAMSGPGGALTMVHEGTRTGRAYVQYELFGSGMGATSRRDGASGLHIHAQNCAITPVEIVESEFPVRLRRFELRPDSGGPGRQRGGLGMRREYEILEPARCSFRGDRHVVAPQGVAGGRPGGPGANWVNPDTPMAMQLPSRRGDYPLLPGDVIRFDTAGGAGYGAPEERDAALLASDVLDGYVSPSEVSRGYGAAAAVLRASAGAVVREDQRQADSEAE
jgi:N-methylhydantoinase B